MRGNHGRIRCAGILFYAFPLVWAVVTLYPLFVALISSVKNNTEIFGAMFKLPVIYQFENYAKAIHYADMINCVKNSIVLAAGSTLVLLVISSMVSFAIAYFRCRFTSFLYVVFLFGMLLPVHSTLIPLAKMLASVNAMNNYLALMLLYAAFELPKSVFIVSGFMKGISQDIYEASFIDGCSAWGALWRIVIPLSLPAVATSAIIAFLFVYNELIFAVLFISEKSLFTISLGLFSFVGYRTVEMGPIFASIILAVAPMIAVYLIFHEKVQKGMLAGAVKE